MASKLYAVYHWPSYNLWNIYSMPPHKTLISVKHKLQYSFQMPI